MSTPTPLPGQPAPASPSPVCPRCGGTHRQIKNGHTACGSPLLRCVDCQYTYNLTPKKQGYPDSLRVQAVKMYVDGLNFRRIARLLGVHHQSVINWVNAHHACLPERSEMPPQNGTDVIEMDELFTFVGSKKTPPMSSP